jgi:hypothetical protein
MKRGRWMWWVGGAAATASVAFVSWQLVPTGTGSPWQQFVNPGPLSASHAFLKTDCAACHTALAGAEPVKCIGCHAGNEALLQRQPTAFHGSIGTCSGCHIEHGGERVRPVAMSHAVLADIGLAMTERGADNATNRRVLTWIREHRASGREPAHPLLSVPEAALDCAACHETRDRHQLQFGRDCAVCHAAATWRIAEFRHPSPRSVDCAQCHRAPPSHYMEHFEMVSQRVAGEPDARVEQCFRCHQTTAWNDIRRIGWYKHH